MRATSIKEVEQKIVSGGEPDFTKTPDMSLSVALNWYSYYKDYKDSKKYLIAYMTKNGYPKTDIEKITKVTDSFISNTGYVCRLLDRGAGLSTKQLNWIQDKINSLLKMSDKPKDDDDKDPTPKVNIQDRIQEQTSEFIGELEGFIDDYKTTFNPYEWMNVNGVKAPHARKIASWFTEKVKEPKLVLSGKADEELEEAYNHLNKTNLKKFVAFIESIIADSTRIINNSKNSRKPRAKKNKPADKLITKMQYKKEDVEFKVVSINPVEIIGAKQLWVLNTKTRKLGVYNAESVNGLTVKGTTINGYESSSSSAKTLRKPNDVLQALAKSTERKYKLTFDGIKATEQALTGRINTDTILLKVFK